MSALTTQPLISSFTPNKPDICRGCNTRPVDTGYKTCLPCRTKRREQKIASKERKKKLLLLDSSNLENSVNGNKIKESEATESTEKSKKRKAEDGGDDSAVLKKKKTVKALLKANRMPLNFDASTKSDQSIEFQSASDLYKRLKKLALREKSLEFSACHSIVADPVVDNAKRASLVARDIKKIAGLSFNYKQTSTPPIRFHNSHSLRYQCTCATKGTAATNADIKASVPSKPQLNGPLSAFISSQGKTSIKASVSPKPQLNGPLSAFIPNQGKTSAVNECNGIIEVTVADDNSHPLGFAGQKISIKVRHAKKME